MTKEMTAKIVLTAVDKASKAMEQSAKTAEKTFKETERAAQQSGNTQAQAAQKVANETTTAHRKLEQSYRNIRKVNAAREVLDIRSENAIQREIEQTRAAYDRLKRSGVASQNELRRASEATKQRVRELNAELGKTSFGEKAANVGRGLMKAGVGIATGVAIAAPKVMATAEYDLALARVADTGYSGASIEEKTKAKRGIHKAISTSITEHGGTKEDALASLNELMSKGKVSVDDALALLPIIQKNATATGANAAELTSMVNSMLNFGVKQSEIQAALDYMNASGKAGGFELADMAQYFPQVLANAGGAGLSGLEDLKKVGLQLQQVYDVSGGASETATNMNNFYSKVKAASTEKNIEKIEFKNPKTGKIQSVNMKASMEKYMKEGKNSGEALLSIIGDILKHDKEYQMMLKQVEAAQGEDKKAVMAKIAKYLEGSVVAGIMPDLQAGLATYAMMNGIKVKENVEEQYALADNGNYNDESYQFFRQQNATRIQIAKNHKEMGEIDTFQRVGDVTADILERYSNFASEFPNLNSALITATEAVKTFGAALAASSVLDLLTGKKGNANGVGDLFDKSSKATGGKGKVSKFLLAGGSFASVAGVATMLHGDQAPMSEERKAQLKDPNYQARQMYEYKKEILGSRFHSFFRSNETLEQYRKDVSAYEAKQSASPNMMGAVQGVLNTIPNLQQAISQDLRPKVDSVSNTLATYQADFQAFGATISAGIEAGLASQSHTIANQITVELDGSVVAEKVANHIFNFNKRMA